MWYQYGFDFTWFWWITFSLKWITGIMLWGCSKISWHIWNIEKQWINHQSLLKIDKIQLVFEQHLNVQMKIDSITIEIKLYYTWCTTILKWLWLLFVGSWVWLGLAFDFHVELWSRRPEEGTRENRGVHLKPNFIYSVICGICVFENSL